ncbi:MAG TPA: anthranilate phosphoribosyltransferase [Candidatus Glassbacteria bacterium]|nr:anthranilate phosphoribosyltransferase [Candidatus Glassbacteria bacterium]
MIVDAIRLLVEGRDLDPDQARETMTEIMEGAALPSQIGAFLTALRLKGETVEEISEFARVMRAKVTPVKSAVHSRLLDTCGTGGDGSGSFNISTAAAFVAAGAGVPVAKHGNRSVSSRCGSADVLKELGINIEASPDTVGRCLDEAGICFIFAPLFHPAMKHAIGPRREIGIRTVFNVLGPLTNPAGATVQLLGVYDRALAETLAGVLGRLGSERAYVVHGHGGLDEISLSGPTAVAQLEAGRVTSFTIRPQDFGIESRPVDSIRGGNAPANAGILRDVLAGQPGPCRDAVVLNAGAAISAFNAGMSIADGITRAVQSIDGGGAADKLEALIETSNR